MSFNLGDMGGIIKQAQEMQKRMQKMKKELKDRVVEAGSGGGMVTAFANGAREIVKLKISKEVVDPGDVEMLEDLVVAACNAALKKAEELNQQELQKVTGGLNVPGLF
jgi:hypothetical protein